MIREGKFMSLEKVFSECIPCSLLALMFTYSRHNLIIQFKAILIATVLIYVDICMVMKSPVLWNIRPCIPLKVNRCFDGASRLDLQGQRWAKQETCVKAGSKLVLLILRSWRWRQHATPCLLRFKGVHGIISQKIKLFITRVIIRQFCFQCKHRIAWNKSTS
jgi:hypothetical protein